MPKSILFCFFACVIFSCQSSEHEKEVVAVDSLRAVLATQKNLLRSFPADSLEWGSHQVNEQYMLLVNLTDSAHGLPFAEYFGMSKSMLDMVQWQTDMLSVLSKDEERLNKLKVALKDKKRIDSGGNAFTPDYVKECLAMERVHLDSIGIIILEQYKTGIQAIQMVRWMSPIMKKEIETIKANQE